MDPKTFTSHSCLPFFFGLVFTQWYQIGVVAHMPRRSLQNGETCRDCHTATTTCKQWLFVNIQDEMTQCIQWVPSVPFSYFFLSFTIFNMNWSNKIHEFYLMLWSRLLAPKKKAFFHVLLTIPLRFPLTFLVPDMCVLQLCQYPGRHGGSSYIPATMQDRGPPTLAATTSSISPLDKQCR